MILNQEKADVIISDNFEETEFSIDTNSDFIIFDMLRSKIYKNNIGAICREVSCNGRDAQREIGDFTTPIEIEISDSRSNFFSEGGLNLIFRDNGIGLSKDRIKNIYTKYGASTKRDTNNQTGGFGLGAKTPFSYSDAFIVKTIVDNIEYVYSIYIDPSRKGKMALLYQEEVENKHNMTEITIPIKDADISRFKNEILKNTHFWSVRPKLINFGNSNYFKFENTIYSESLSEELKKEYSIIEKQDFIESNINAIVDGIYYPIDMKIVNYKFDNKEFAICLYFNNGELNISANRENLQYDDNTIKIIKQKIDFLLDEYAKPYILKINTQENLFLAQVLFNKFVSKNSLFKMLLEKQSNIIKYKDEILTYNKTLKFKTINVNCIRLDKDKYNYKFEIKDIFYDSDFLECYKESYFISEKDNNLHKRRLSAPITRAISQKINKNFGKFILFSSKTENDYKNVFDRNEYDINHKIDIENLIKYGFKLENYWEVEPKKVEKIPKVPKIKTEFVSFKAVTKDDFINSYKIKYIDKNLCNTDGIKNNNIYYYEINEKDDLNEKIKSTFKEITNIASMMNDNIIICFSTISKRKYFKNNKHINSYILEKQQKINDILTRFELSNLIQKTKEYSKYKIEIENQEDFLYLSKLNSELYININEFVNYIKKNIPNFIFNDFVDIKRKYSLIDWNIKKKYPLIENFYNENNKKDYIKLINENEGIKEENNKLKEENNKLITEKNKYNHFIN